MGNTYNYKKNKNFKDTHYYKTLINCIYKTTVPTYISYPYKSSSLKLTTDYKKCKTIHYGDISSIFIMEVNPGMKFKITDIDLYDGFDAPAKIEIKIKLCNFSKQDMANRYFINNDDASRKNIDKIGLFGTKLMESSIILYNNNFIETLPNNKELSDDNLKWFESTKPIINNNIVKLDNVSLHLRT